MERSSRRSAMSNGGSSGGPGGYASGRRRRRDASAEASASASASDGADTDSSSLASASRKRDASAGEPRTRSSRRSAAREEQEDEERGEEREEEKQELSEPEDAASSSSDKPARRERSLSNVSTTSSTSSGVSEPRNAEARHARHAQKMGELEQKRKMVEDGTLAEYCRRVTEFKEDRNRLLQMAEWHKNLQLKNGGELYAFELQRAEHLWLHGKEVLKADMVGKLDEVKAKILRELEDLSKPGANPPRLSSPVSEALLAEADSNPEAATPAENTDAVAETVDVETESPVVNGEPAQKKRKMELPEDLVRLSFDDISADLAAIAIDRKGHSEAANAALPSTQLEPMKIERRRLFCGKNIFQDGDEVVIASPVIKEDYVGRISSVTDEAVYVKLSSGQKVRIYLDLIKSKRCELKPLLRGLPALVEYESY